jgi:hypothetical protein
MKIILLHNQHWVVLLLLLLFLLLLLLPLLLILPTAITTTTTGTLLSSSSFRLKAQIIDGARIAQDIRRELKVEVDEWVAQGNRRPHLTALLVGEDPASATYVKNKMQAAREIGKRQIV